MPTIAEDLTTPQPVYGSTSASAAQSVTTAKFSPPGHCLLVAMVPCHLVSGTPSITVSDSSGLTWTKKIDAGTGAYASIWTAPVAAAPGSITVTAANATAQAGTLGLIVRVDTGANGTQTGAATASNTNALSTAPQLAITSTTKASWVYVLCTGGGPEVKVSPVNVATLTLDNYQESTWIGSSLLSGKQTTPTGTPGSTTLGWNWTVPHTWTVVALEILAADVPVSSADTGTGADGNAGFAKVKVLVPAADAGTGLDVTKAVTGTGAPSLMSSSDTGSGTDATGSVPVKWTSVGSADAGTGSESATGPATVSVSSADYGTGGELNAVPYRNPGFSFFANLLVQEGFSLSRVAALNGTTGAEQAQLYGAQSISLVPDTSVSDMQADDEEYGSWYTMNKAALSVVNGFMSWSVISSLSGVTIASSGASPADYYGLPLWTQYQHNQPSVPLAFSMSGRNANGAVRTLAFVLYKVQLSVLDFTGTVYKTGLQVNYAGTVLFSSTDERGNTLAGPEIGRIVSSAGASAGVFAPQPFAGV